MSKFIPNSFQVPNAVIDELMAELTGAELKCYLYVLRKTKGWNKESDAISVSQFMEACNLSNRKVIDACNRLVALNLFEQKTGARGVKIFSVKNFTCEESSLVKKVHSTSEESSQVTSEESSHTKYQVKNTIQNTTPLNPPVGETQGESVAVLDFLNDRLAALSAEVNITLPKFKPVLNTLKAIAARLKESSVADCQRVVEYLVARWGRDDKMRDYLSPKTIFRPNNFTEYLTKSQAWAANGKPVLVAGKWVNPQQAEMQASTPTVEEVKALYSQLLNRPSLFRSWQFATLKEKALYYATIAVKNKRPLEREVNFVCRDAISDVMAKIDRLAAPKFD